MYLCLYLFILSNSHHSFNMHAWIYNLIAIEDTLVTDFFTILIILLYTNTIYETNATYQSLQYRLHATTLDFTFFHVLVKLGQHELEDLWFLSRFLVQV